MVSTSDYYPFGFEMVDRTENSATYRYGFNGKEKDENSEWGSQTHYDYGFRIYNPGIAKFLSVDPLTQKYPELTPYQFASNRPIDGIDLDGLEYDDSKLKFTINHDRSQIKVEGEISVKIKIINLSSSTPQQKFMDYHDRKSSETFDSYNAISFDSHVNFDPETGKLLNKKYSIEGDLNFNFEFISVESSLDAIEKGDVVLILADKLSGSEDHAGTAHRGGYAYILEVDVFNDKNHVDTHEKGHLVGDFVDIKGKNAPKGFLMSYGDDGTGYRLRRVEKENLIEQTIYRKGMEKQTNKKRDTRKDAEYLIETEVEKN